WYWLSQAASLVLLFFTVVSGATALITGKMLNERQSKQVLKLETELSKQREKTALAEKSVLELQEKLKPRHLPEREKFVSFLSEQKSGPLEIQYSANDVESRLFALEIEAALKDAGWSEVSINNSMLILPQPV